MGGFGAAYLSLKSEQQYFGLFVSYNGYLMPTKEPIIKNEKRLENYEFEYFKLTKSYFFN